MFRLIKRCLVLGLFVVLLSAATVVWIHHYGVVFTAATSNFDRNMFAIFS